MITEEDFVTFKVKDHYFNKAKQENYLARSIYKLEEIDKKFKIISSNDYVMDFGYYPGSWVQYASTRVGPQGLVVGIDIQKVNTKLLNIPQVRLYEHSINDDIQIGELLPLEDKKSKFDVVLSDMAPSTTGIKIVDQENSLQLVRKVFSLLPLFLKTGGNTVIKVFEGADAQIFLREQKNLKIFKEFHYLRPKSTRSISKEFYVIGKGYKALPL